MTYVINTNELNPHLPDIDLLSFVNQLPVNLLDFSIISCLYARALGVKTHCDPLCWENEWLNQCGRDNVWRLLLSVQQNLIATKRAVLAPMYIVEEQMWYPDKTIKAKFGNIDAVNVSRIFTEVDTVAISPFIAETVTLRDSMAGFVEALVPASVVTNPENVIFREPQASINSTVYGNRIPQPQVGYPYLDGTNWVYSMNLNVQLSTVIHAQDCDYTYVDITPVVGHTIDDIVFMYPPQDQIVPQAKKPEVTSGGDWRYWFYVWTLKRVEYGHMQTDLTQARDFDHLYSSLRYGYYTELQTPAVIYAADANCCNTGEDEEILALGKITSGEQGVLRFAYAEEVTPATDPPTYSITCDDCVTPCCDKVQYKIRFYYKVSPSVSGLENLTIEALRIGIVKKVAANIPMENCKCPKVEEGFIYAQQIDVPKVIPNAFGAPVIQYRHGTREGDLAYYYVLNNMASIKRMVFV